MDATGTETPIDIGADVIGSDGKKVGTVTYVVVQPAEMRITDIVVSTGAILGRDIGADVLLKATRVDGIYDSDPEKNPYAEKYDRLTYQKVLHDRLKVMDLSAFDMCQEARLAILVFNYKADRAIERAVAGHPIGTLVTAD